MTRLILRAVPRLASSFALAALTCLAAPAHAADFYSGKSVNFLIATPPGGGYDAASRLLIRYMPKYIPGEPKMVAQNMPGAGGFRLAGFMSSVAPKDGTTIAMHTRGVTQAPVLGEEGANFDANAFTWIGTMSSAQNDAYLLVVNKTRGIASLEDMRNANPPVTLGGTGGITSNVIFGLMSPQLFGFKTKMIVGYNGSVEVMLALKRKELDGAYAGLASLMTTQSEEMKSGELVPVVQLARRTPHPDYANVPVGQDLLKNADDKALLAFVESIFYVALPISGPPGMPADRLKILREAFMKANTDPAYLADAKKLNLDATPLDGEEVAKIVAEMNKTSPAVIERYKAVIAAAK